VEPLVNDAVAAMLRVQPEVPPAIRELWGRARVSADGTAGGVPEESPRRLAEIHAYLMTLLGAAREQPGDDPLGVFVRVGDADPEVSDADLVANLVFVMNSGHRDLAQGLGLFLHTLATRPDAYAFLLERPDLVRGAVEALLRHDTSVQFTSRRIAAPVALGDRPLESGHLAVLMLGAANRDPEAFADPDGLDVEHASAKHVAFGYGPHFCAGAAVSRLILHEALAALVECAPRLELAEPPIWTTFRLNMRGCERLQVRW
jgi:cytochrome P450